MIYLKIIILHPYQGLYFNNLVTDKKKDAFEIDYWGLAGVKSLNYILSLEKNNSEIKIARATFVPLERSLSLLSEENAKKIKIVGQNYQDANYIFSMSYADFKNEVYDKTELKDDGTKYNLQTYHHSVKKYLEKMIDSNYTNTLVNYKHSKTK